MEHVKVKLSDYQKSKFKYAFKNKASVIIQFKNDQLNKGNDTIILTKKQFNKFNKHLKNNTGLRIEFSYNQLKEFKDGGLLKEILDVAEHIPIVKNYTPNVRKGAKVIKESVIPKFRNLIDWIDHELSNVQGSGLDKNTLKYIKKNLKKNLNH